MAVALEALARLSDAIHSSQEVALVTDLLEEAFAKATRLPDDEQDAFARWCTSSNQRRPMSLFS